MAEHPIRPRGIGIAGDAAHLQNHAIADLRRPTTNAIAVKTMRMIACKAYKRLLFVAYPADRCCPSS